MSRVEEGKRLLTEAYTTLEKVTKLRYMNQEDRNKLQLYAKQFYNLFFDTENFVCTEPELAALKFLMIGFTSMWERHYSKYICITNNITNITLWFHPKVVISGGVTVTVAM